MKPLQGLITGLERFALHDGPGIRTLVFAKGCPIRCLWCSSPQTQRRSPEILYQIGKCQRCGGCQGACPVEAMSLSEEEGVRIDREACTGCGECVEACSNDALELVGRQVSSEELIGEVLKDSPFYRRSGGGVTLGGGEPTLQYEFVLELLEGCKRQHLHTVMETCGFVSWRHLEKILDYLDLVYLDIKHMDSVAHEALTGVPNPLILENARRIASRCPLIVRIPVVPGLNDSDENIMRTAEFAGGLGGNLKRIELLPYHGLGVQTYAELGREYRLRDVLPPDDRHMKRLAEIIESRGVSARTGG